MTVQRLTYYGMQGSGDWKVPDNRPLDWRQEAFKLFPDSPAPFTSILSKLPTRTVMDPEFKFFEWRLPKQHFVVETEVALSAAAHDVDTVELKTTTEDANEPTDPARWLKPGDLLINETTGIEIVRVVSITDDDTITVSRYWGGTATPGTTVIAADAVLRWAGSAYGEGTAAPSAISRRTSTVTNYTQIHKDTAFMTGTAMATKVRPFASSWATLKQEALERHMMKIEYSLLYGSKEETTVGGSGYDAGQPLRASSGFRKLVGDANGIENFGGNGITMDEFEDAVEEAWRYGSKTKIAFMGSVALNTLQRLVRENTQFQFRGDLDPNKTYNLNVSRFRHPFGQMDIILHPLLTESAAWRSEAYIVDPKYASFVKLKGRDTDWAERKKKETDDLQDNVLGSWMTECALELALPECHAVWSGLTDTEAV